MVERSERLSDIEERSEVLMAKAETFVHISQQLAAHEAEKAAEQKARQKNQLKYIHV